jgi:uncharacterized protein YjbI with pentapeptide repeats
MASRDPITWAALRAKLTTLPLPSTNAGRLAVFGGIVLLLLLVLPWYAKGHKDEKGVVTYPNAALINPILAGLGAILLIYAAIRQAQTASSRHEAQTKADLQRRITESFSKAIEQLGSDKLEVRLGGIYALERISQESSRDYWTVMENLTAFVRERTQRTEAERTAKPSDQRIAERAYLLWENAGRPEGRSDEFWREAVEHEPEPPNGGESPATDVAAVLTIIERRDEEHRALEAQDKRVLDLQQAVLRRADLNGAHLERANFIEAHLEGARLNGAYLERARLNGAHLEGADLSKAHLEGADLIEAHLERTFLGDAHLEGTLLRRAHFEGADLSRAHLERTRLDGAHLERTNFIEAHLEGARLNGAYLERARLNGAHLEGADLSKAHLERTRLNGAHLEGARLNGAHLERAHLNGAYLEGTNLRAAHFHGADLSGAEGLTQAQIYQAFGDANTELPKGLTRPMHWPQPDRGAEPAA